MSTPHTEAVTSVDQKRKAHTVSGRGSRINEAIRTPAMALVAIVAIGTLLAFFRVPAASAETVWAEDGRVFLEDYLENGPALLAPYDGYLHFLPRIIAAASASVFGVEAYAVAVTAACSLVIGLVAAITYYCSSALTDNTTARLAWASIPVLVAPGALETMGNAANLHWYLLWLLPWTLLKAPETWGQKLLLASSALAAALTEIQTALFLPLLIWKFRDKSRWWARSGFIIGLACQFTTFLMFPREREGMGQDWDLLSVIYGYFLNSSAALVYGSSAVITNLIQTFGAAPIVLSAIMFAVIIVLAVRFADGVPRIAALTWLFASTGIWAAAVVINPAPYFRYAEFSTPEAWAGFFLSRYSTVPTMFLLAFVPLLIAASSIEKPRYQASRLVRDPRFRSAVLGAFLVLQSVHYFPVDAPAAVGPTWAEGVQQARLSCLSDPALRSVEILQAPAGWQVTLRCEDL